MVRSSTLAAMASPLLGYNNNVRHLGKLYHIQTEDSGTQHAHIFTHLFADGGRIIATKKTTYAQYIGSPRFAEQVKKLMQAQHKAMFIALRDGLFDGDEAAGAREFATRSIGLDEEPAAPAKALDPALLDRLADGYLAPAPRAPTEPPPAVKPSEPAPPLRPSSHPGGRYQTTTAVSPIPRPAPVPTSDSLFGQSLLSDKSLDEVILSYLAEDIDPKDGG